MIHLLRSNNLKWEELPSTSSLMWKNLELNIWIATASQQCKLESRRSSRAKPSPSGHTSALRSVR